MCYILGQTGPCLWYCSAFKNLENLESRFKTEVLTAFVRAQATQKSSAGVKQDDRGRINRPDGQTHRPQVPPYYGRQDRFVFCMLCVHFSELSKPFGGTVCCLSYESLCLCILSQAQSTHKFKFFLWELNEEMAWYKDRSSSAVSRNVQFLYCYAFILLVTFLLVVQNVSLKLCFHAVYKSNFSVSQSVTPLELCSM